jgi:hypothetical protein
MNVKSGGTYTYHWALNGANDGEAERLMEQTIV